MRPFLARWCVFVSMLALPALCAIGRGAAQDAIASDRALSDAIALAGATECVTHEALLESVRTWLRRDTLDPDLAIVVDATAPGASIVVLERQQARATRRFEQLPRTCADQRAVLGLAIAIAIDAALVDALVPAAADAPVDEEPPAARSEATVTATEAPTRSLAVELGAEAGLALGMLADPSARVGLSLSFVFDTSFRLGVSGFVTSPATQPLNAGHVRSLIAAGRVDACVVRADPILDVAGCIGLALGALTAEGIGFTETYSVAMPYVAPMARLEATAWLDAALGVHLAVDASYQLADLRLRVVDPGGGVSGEVLVPSAAVVVTAGFRARF